MAPADRPATTVEDAAAEPGSEAPQPEAKTEQEAPELTEEEEIQLVVDGRQQVGEVGAGAARRQLAGGADHGGARVGGPEVERQHAWHHGVG